jgi:hypothetical protein
MSTPIEIVEHVIGNLSDGKLVRIVFHRDNLNDKPVFFISSADGSYVLSTVAGHTIVNKRGTVHTELPDGVTLNRAGDSTHRPQRGRIGCYSGEASLELIRPEEMRGLKRDLTFIDKEVKARVNTFLGNPRATGGRRHRKTRRARKTRTRRS